ncbi:MAG: PIN domain-containing protein [Rhodanobacteraceae bacterium]
MSAEIFVDTNILYYANTDSDDPRHATARQCVAELWRVPGRAAVSVQVLQELHVNLTRKAHLSQQQSAQRVGDYLAWRVIDNDRALLLSAFEVQARWQLSCWDSLIVAAAQRSGASVLWSEDLSNGQRFDSLVPTNPLSELAAG